MYAAAALALVAVLVTFATLVEPARHVHAESATGLRIGDQRVFPYLLGWFIIFMVFTGVQVITPFLIEDRFAVSGREAITQVAMFALLAMAVVTLVVQIVVMQVWKLSPKLLLRTSFLIYAGVLVIFAYSESLLMLYLSYAGMGLSFALAAPGLNAAASLAVEPPEQGAVAGWLSSAPAFGMIFGPALGGVVYNIAPDLPMLGGAVLSLLVGVYFYFVAIPDSQHQAG